MKDDDDIELSMPIINDIGLEDVMLQQRGTLGEYIANKSMEWGARAELCVFGARAGTPSCVRGLIDGGRYDPCVVGGQGGEGRKAEGITQKSTLRG